MGSYNFTWTHPAEEVYVTGTFDNWQKSTRMVKGANGVFSAMVDVPMDKTMYKFVVDGNWTTDSTHRIESDHEGNLNNYILPEDVTPAHAEPTFTTPAIASESDTTSAPHIQSAGPQSTTAGLAAAVPLEPKRDLAAEEAAKHHDSSADAFTSSAAPQSTTSALAAEVPLEKNREMPTVVPSATGIDTETPHVPAASEETVGISPLPASNSATNPVTLAPGETLPPSVASVDDNVKLDKESYDKPDASNLGVGAAAASGLAAVTGAMGYLYNSVVSKHEETKTEGSEIAIPETAKNIIPESALPMTIPGVGNVTGATTSTAADTAAVTTTTDTVPEMVKESQLEANQEPEASGVPAAVEHKKEVEDELLKEIKPASSATTGIAPVENVPAIVQNSQVSAGVAPEASAIRDAVLAKKAMEGELKKEVTPVKPEPALDTTATSGTLSGPFSSDPVDSSVSEPTASAVPEVVKESIAESGKSPEAAANPEAVEAKAEVEQAITRGAGMSTANTTSTPTTGMATADTTTTSTTGLSTADTTTTPTAATTATTPMATEPVAASSTKETTPASTTTTPVKSEPIASSSQSVTSKDESAAAKDKKKKKRASMMFGKIKSIFKDKE